LPLRADKAAGGSAALSSKLSSSLGWAGVLLWMLLALLVLESFLFHRRAVY
jgi:hypothetical protein